MSLPMTRTTAATQLRSRAFLIYRGAVAADSPVQCVADVHAVLGEGPVWVAREGALYWVDINARKVFRLDDGGEVREWPTPFRVGSLAPRASGGVIVGPPPGPAPGGLPPRQIRNPPHPGEKPPGNRPHHRHGGRPGRLLGGGRG